MITTGIPPNSPHSSIFSPNFSQHPVSQPMTSFTQSFLTSDSRRCRLKLKLWLGLSDLVKTSCNPKLHQILVDHTLIHCQHQFTHQRPFFLDRKMSISHNASLLPLPPLTALTLGSHLCIHPHSLMGLSLLIPPPTPHLCIHPHWHMFPYPHIHLHPHIRLHLLLRFDGANRNVGLPSMTIYM